MEEPDGRPGNTWGREPRTKPMITGNVIVGLFSIAFFKSPERSTIPITNPIQRGIRGTKSKLERYVISPS